MAQEISLERYKKAYREVREEEEKRGFLAHLVVYVFKKIYIGSTCFDLKDVRAEICRLGRNSWKKFLEER